MSILQFSRLFSIVFLISCLNVQNIQAQNPDSLQLDFDKLDWKDIQTDKDLSVSTQVISGSRSSKKIEDLPFPIFVITKEDIQQNGYLTLADALKRLPGIRVSQPGSAIEGETFLMRGLPGNAYTKILINDIPLKPFVVNGMPIGAQLPIREAERIEVIYGPAATLYGADASAGVINIILKESERPVYAQADLGLGGLGFQNLDVMFGGKVGKNKKILSFNVFGNFTSFNNRRVIYNRDSLYNPQTYENFWNTETVSYSDRPNYRGEDTEPLLNKLPHLSNTLGFELSYQNWKISYLSMYRRDHSSLGMSPLAVSYANPLNFFGEKITSTQIAHSKTKNRWRTKKAINILTYQTDDRSSFSYILPGLAYFHHLIAQSSANPDSLSTALDDIFYSGSRFSSASSFEFEGEFLAGYTLNENIEFAGGTSIRGGFGDPLRHFSPDPIDIDSDSTYNQNVNTNIVGYIDTNVFIESHINFKKWNAIIGTQIFKRQTDFSSNQQSLLNPRIAIQYQWTDKFSLRASTSQSYKYPSPFYSSNSYTIDLDFLEQLQTGVELSPEKTNSVELGSRWSIGDKLSGDLSLYYTTTSNFIGYNIQVEQGRSITLGYINDPASSVELYGIQSQFIFRNLLPSNGLNATFNVHYSRGREVRKGFSLEQDSANSFTFVFDRLRSQPDWIIQGDFEFRTGKKLRLLLENTWMTSSLRQNSIYYRSDESQVERQLINPGFYTLDLNLNYQVNRQLLVLLRMNNFFNTQYAGIDSSFNSDGLFYNPQSLRFFRIGVNYRLE